MATVFSRWYGREAFHAGGVVIEGGAWALLGPKEAGKSTLLAAVAARGGAVLTDDLVVVDGDRAFAGPRCIDLRSPLPGDLGGDVSLAGTRAASRWRMRLDPIVDSVPLRGWVFLHWGEPPELSPITARECLSRLAQWRVWRDLRSDPVQLLRLACLPGFRLNRSHDWARLPETVDGLTDMLGSTPSAARAFR